MTCSIPWGWVPKLCILNKLSWQVTKPQYHCPVLCTFSRKKPCLPTYHAVPFLWAFAQALPLTGQSLPLSWSFKTQVQVTSLLESRRFFTLILKALLGASRVQPSIALLSHLVAAEPYYPSPHQTSSSPPSSVPPAPCIAPHHSVC